MRGGRGLRPGGSFLPQGRVGGGGVAARWVPPAALCPRPNTGLSAGFGVPQSRRGGPVGSHRSARAGNRWGGRTTKDNSGSSGRNGAAFYPFYFFLSFPPPPHPPTRLLLLAALIPKAVFALGGSSSALPNGRMGVVGWGWSDGRGGGNAHLALGLLQNPCCWDSFVERGKKKRKCSGRHREEFSFFRGRKTPSLCPVPCMHFSAWAFPSKTTGIANASSRGFPRLVDFVALFRKRNGNVNNTTRTLLVFPAC